MGDDDDDGDDEDYDDENELCVSLVTEAQLKIQPSILVSGSRLKYCLM